MTRCMGTERGKVRYGTQEAAIRVATRRAFAFRGLYMRVYCCPKCGGWHLTKKRPR